MKLNLSHLFFLLIFSFSFFVYFKTVSPAVTWAHFGENGPKFLTQIYAEPLSLDQKHLPYIALAKFFQFLTSNFQPPNTDPSFPINLLSAFFAALTTSFIFLTIFNLSHKSRLSILVAAFTAVCFTLSPVFWSQAVITETVTFNTFLLSLLIFFVAQAKSSKRNVFASLFPLGFLGLNLFPFSPLRIKFHSVSEIFSNLETVVDLFLKNFPGFLLLFTFFGVIWGFSERKKLAVALGGLVVSEVAFDSLFSLSTTTPFYLPSFLVFSIFMGLGLKIIVEIIIKLTQSELAVSFENQFFLLIFRLKEAGKILKYATFAFLTFWFLNTPFYLFRTVRPKVDLSKNFEALNFGKEAFAVLPHNSLLITETDRFFNTLDYFGKVVEKRHDITIIPAGKDMEEVVKKSIKRQPVFLALAAPPIPVGEIKGKWNNYTLISKGPLYQVLPP